MQNNKFIMFSMKSIGNMCFLESWDYFVRGFNFMIKSNEQLAHAFILLFAQTFLFAQKLLIYDNICSLYCKYNDR
jgi:hypothetical protein